MKSSLILASSAVIGTVYAYAVQHSLENAIPFDNAGPVLADFATPPPYSQYDPSYYSNAEYYASNALGVESGAPSKVPPQEDESPFTPMEHLQQPPSRDGLRPGDVFGLVTVSGNDDVNGETVIIYNDGTLGINEPSGPGYLFEGLLMPEYNLLLAPEPLSTVKLNDQGVFFLNDSLFNPAPIFASQGWNLRIAGGSPVICPSWNSVLVMAKDNEPIPCEDGVSVSLGIVPITIE